MSCQPLSRREHAVTDYSYIPTVAAAPELFGFADDPRAARAARVFAGTILVSTFFTRAEWGVVRVMPYKAHVTIDAAAGVAALLAPWVCGFADNRAARNTFLAMGVAGLVVGLISRPEEMQPQDGRTP